MASARPRPRPHPEGMLAYAAPSLFQPHLARQALRDAHAKKVPPLLGYYAGLSSVPITRFMAPVGFDVVWFDWEHSACNVETMTTMVHESIFLSRGRTIPFVRVPGHDHASIGWALDAGASIIVPQVDTAEQARHVIAAAKFGRSGTRSAPPFRLVPGLTDQPADPARGDVWANANEQAAVIIQVETPEGVRNLDAILEAVPDIDAVWLGTLDARVSMGLSAAGGISGGKEEEWLEVVDLFERTMDKYGKPKAGFCLGGPEKIAEMHERGYVFLLIAADVLQLGGMQGVLTAARGVFEKGSE